MKMNSKALAKRIRAEWGDSCSDHDAECPVCNAWDFYYAAVKAEQAAKAAPKLIMAGGFVAGD